MSETFADEIRSAARVLDEVTFPVWLVPILAAVSELLTTAAIRADSGDLDDAALKVARAIKNLPQLDQETIHV